MPYNRRSAIKNILTGSAAVSAAGMLSSFKSVKFEVEENLPLKGNINHSACWWVYQSFGLEQLCIEFKKIGLKGIDLLNPAQWPTIQKHGIDSPMCNGAELGLYDGFNDKKFHDKLINQYSDMIPLVSKAGYKNLICFSGARRGMSDEEGWSNCVTGLQKLLPLAEKHKVTLVMELLNSKIDHKDYQCDRAWWGAELAKRLGSENFKLLFDIYHMQIDEGDIIRNIRQYHQYIAHYHTGGVPGRNEIDDTQELYYPAIMKAIVATGFKGYVAQEFSPKNPDKLAALKKCVHICDV